MSTTTSTTTFSSTVRSVTFSSSGTEGKDRLGPARRHPHVAGCQEGAF